MVDMNNILGKEFWQYSCALYGNKPVEVACLDLQNDFQADVNLLLFICWLTHKEYIASDKKTIKAMIEISTPWQRDVVEPLRQLRQQIGAMQGMDAKNVKTSLLRSEQEAEKYEQFALVGLIESLEKFKNIPSKIVDKQTTANKALLHYIDTLGKTIDKPCEDHINILVEHAFGD